MKHSRKLNSIAEVCYIKEINESGITMPLKCRLSTMEDAYVKYPGNPVGIEVLVNEWIGSRIADTLGLTIPDYGICRLSEIVIFNSDIEDIDITNSGLAFFTIARSKTVPANRKLLQKVSNKELENLLVFDHLVNNCDRHKGNVLCEIKKSIQMLIIDNSQLFSNHLRYDENILINELDKNRILSDLIYKENEELYDLLFDTIGYNKDTLYLKALSAKESLDDDTLDEIWRSIPNAWVDGVGVEVIRLIFEQIRARRELIIEICDRIVLERGRI